MPNKPVRAMTAAEFEDAWARLGNEPAGLAQMESEDDSAEVESLTPERFAAAWRDLGHEAKGNGIIRGRFFETQARLVAANAEDAAIDAQAKRIADELIRSADAHAARKAEERVRFDATGRRGA